MPPPNSQDFNVFELGIFSNVQAEKENLDLQSLSDFYYLKCVLNLHLLQ